MGSKWVTALYIGTMLLCMSVDMTAYSYHIINNMACEATIIGNSVPMRKIGNQYNKVENIKKDDEHISEYELQEMICETIESLSCSSQGDRCIFPEGTKLNKVIVIDRSLLLDFSEHLLNYGGTERERLLIKTILDIAFSFDEINDVTIAIDGEVENLVEGSIVNGYTRGKWEKEREDNDE